MAIDNINEIKRKILNEGRPVPSAGLTGMISDLYYFLEQSGILKVVKVMKTGDPYRMLEVRCKPTT
jgi:hypothetical protein